MRIRRKYNGVRLPHTEQVQLRSSEQAPGTQRGPSEAHATSLPHDCRTARRVVKLYGLRMKIEEGIRDTKNVRWGFALQYARSRRVARLEILLLIAALGAIVCWLAGRVAEDRQWTRHFQANTVRGSTVLSPVFVGRQVLASARVTTHFHLRMRSHAIAAPRPATGGWPLPDARRTRGDYTVISWGSLSAHVQLQPDATNAARSAASTARLSAATPR